jgi:hypothetical protein
MILKYSVHPLVPGESATVRRQRELLGLPDLESWRDYYVEVREPPAEDAAAALQAALGDPLTETVRVGEPIEPGAMVQVTYKRGIVDNENDSIVAFSQLFGVDAVHARVGTTYVSADSALA